MTVISCFFRPKQRHQNLPVPLKGLGENAFDMWPISNAQSRSLFKVGSNLWYLRTIADITQTLFRICGTKADQCSDWEALSFERSLSLLYLASNWILPCWFIVGTGAHARTAPSPNPRLHLFIAASVPVTVLFRFLPVLRTALLWIESTHETKHYNSSPPSKSPYESMTPGDMSVINESINKDMKQ